MSGMTDRNFWKSNLLSICIIIFCLGVLLVTVVDYINGPMGPKADKKNETFGGTLAYFDPANPEETYEIFQDGDVWFINLRLRKQYDGVIKAMNKYEEWKKEHTELEVIDFDYELYPGYKLDQHLVIVQTKPAN